MNTTKENGVGCLIILGISLMTVGGWLWWGPQILFFTGSVLFFLALAAA